ncbi:CocE/NonD family hydrolase [Lacisediminihabitans sp. FW035]
MNRTLVKRNGFWLVLSLALCLVSAIGASLVQTSGGSVTIKSMSWETESGQTLSALLLKPASASADKKLPAIVLAHGWWNEKEMQDSNYVELARRGYVVMSIDMYGHGSSSSMPEGKEMDAATGMYDAVKEISRLPYVDASRIGVSGHSNGARAANWAVGLDNAADTPLIKSVYLVDNDPIYADAKTGKYVNYYGNRDVGLMADQYDEFFFRSYDKNGKALTTPRQYITTPNAQSFLHFGADPSGESARSSYKTYSEDVDGRQAIRVIENPAQTHPWGPISKSEVTGLLNFFDKSLGAPNPIASGSQIWQVKAVFNALGLVGFGIFLLAFARALLGVRLFAGLRFDRSVELVGNSRTGLRWFWGGLVVSALFSGVSYVLLSQTTALSTAVFVGLPPLIPQGAVFFIGLWAAINGIAALIIMTVSYQLFGKRNGLSLRESGVLPGWRKFWLGILLGLITVVAAFGIVFVLGYFFLTDFRLWVLAIPTFTADKLGIALMYLPLFLIYFLANSVAINSFNRFTIRGREWGNTAVLALFNSLAPIILVAAQYTVFAITGELIPGFGGIFSIWLFPVIVILFVTAVIGRKIYRVTNNPYIGGFISAAVVTVISVTNTLTYR